MTKHKKCAELNIGINALNAQTTVNLSCSQLRLQRSQMRGKEMKACNVK